MKISEKEFRELLDRYLNETATPAERQMLDRFFESYQAELKNSALSPYPELQEEILRRVHARIDVDETKRQRRTIRLWIPLAAAVSLFVLAWFFFDDMKLLSRQHQQALTFMEQKTSPGQKSEIALSDGTKVFLNGDSKISYSNSFGEKTREVKVTGEAYFEVVKDTRPFIVHVANLKTQVTGTSFNVRSRDGERPQITLVEGSVTVLTNSGQSSSLKPNQQAMLENSGDLITREVNVLRYTSWKDNTLIFEQTTLREAISELQTWYAVKIDIINPALQQCVITAKYQDEPLGNVLSSFEFLLNLKITRINEGHYALNGTGCK